eukprot:m.215421 g.215421  ORF g.215421 m.215421 type:complete len:562 (+) comp18638_c2_seq1:242-1927(+)
MCGILCVFGDGATKPHVCQRADQLALRMQPRGPDSRSGAVPLGDKAVVCHERLSIVGLADGSQPLYSPCKRYVLVCNGEIYNHAELEETLAKGRAALQTHSDCEVLVHLFAERSGDLGFLGDVHGMYAFVVVDTLSNTMVAVRDPLGIKPLYIGRESDTGLVWLASELKALPASASVFSVPPGHVWHSATGSADGSGSDTDTGFRFQRYFRPPWDCQTHNMMCGELCTATCQRSLVLPPSECTKKAALVAALDRAVQRRLMADVPTGAFLSGGLDSSLICALMRPHVKDLHTFTVGIEGSPDVLAARTVAKHIDSIHHEYLFDPKELLALVPTVVPLMESHDPSWLVSGVCEYVLSELAAKHVKVVLTGEGSDELFAGYSHFHHAPTGLDLKLEVRRLVWLMQSLVLQRVDRLTMCHGLEARVPFLDLDVVQAAVGIEPADLLVTDDKPIEKWFLRSAFAEHMPGLLPDEVLWRNKMMFGEGVGTDWRDALADSCASKVSDAEFRLAATTYPEDPPTTKLGLFLRQRFESLYGARAVASVGPTWESGKYVGCDWFEDGFCS